MSLTAALQDLLDSNGDWGGTPLDLFEQLNASATFFGWNEEIDWPGDAADLMVVLNREAARIKEAGISVKEGWIGDGTLVISRLDTAQGEVPLTNENDLYALPRKAKPDISVEDRQRRDTGRGEQTVSDPPSRLNSDIRGQGSTGPMTANAKPAPSPRSIPTDDIRLQRSTKREQEMLFNPSSRTCLTCAFGKQTQECIHPSGNQRSEEVIESEQLVLMLGWGTEGIRIKCPGWME